MSEIVTLFTSHKMTDQQEDTPEEEEAHLELDTWEEEEAHLEADNPEEDGDHHPFRYPNRNKENW